jgi:hypothetical protein
MAAKHQETRNFSADKEKLMYNAKLAMYSNGFAVHYEDPKTGFLMGKSGMSLFSWGENMTVTIEDNGNVTIKSESAMPTQLIDWGRNKKMVHKIFASLATVRP